MAEQKIVKKKLSPTACICLLSKLKCQETYLMNVQTSLEIHFADDDEEAAEERKLLAEIDVLRDRLLVDFIALRTTAHNTVAAARETIEEFKGMGANIQQYNLKDYRERVLQIEENLVRVQNTNKLNMGKLKFEQMDIVDTIPPATDLIRDDCRRYQSIPHKMTQLRKPIDEGVYKDVKAFDQFLEDFGGHTGGWGEEQHVIFMRNKAKYQNNIRRITEILLEIIPAITAADIENHDKWFEEYTRLKANRKKSLEEWRKSK